jgi:predicted ribosome quality control (RQC) complex YloA/Tae2 family protein
MICDIFSFNREIYTIYVGQDKNENAELIDSADQNDVWFHVEDMTSCHVLLKHNMHVKRYPKQVIKRCAYLCKINSKAKTLSKCNIIYTCISNIKKTDIVGEVIAQNLKIVQV